MILLLLISISLVVSIQPINCFTVLQVSQTKVNSINRIRNYNFSPIEKKSNLNNEQSLSQNYYNNIQQLALSSNNNNNNDNNDMDDRLNQKFGKYTTKQRLREEVESPFRTVRLFFFGSSTASALLALYFSSINLLKASTMTSASSSMLTTGPTFDESLQSCIINIIAVFVCGAITYRDWLAGEANLQRIAKGGALARLQVTAPPSLLSSSSSSLSSSSTSLDQSTSVPLATYRRTNRILIAAGGSNYIKTLCQTLNSDQRSDTNTYPQRLQACDVIIVPVLLEQGSSSSTNNNNKLNIRVGDTKTCWMNTQIDNTNTTNYRNFNIDRSLNVIAFPKRVVDWDEYLESEIDTAITKQNVDVLNKGIIILVKKNGRILRRATGQPQFNDIVSTMDVIDSNRFGMPTM